MSLFKIVVMILLMFVIQKFTLPHNVNFLCFVFYSFGTIYFKMITSTNIHLQTEYRYLNCVLVLNTFYWS